MIFSQSEFNIRCEWGENGVAQLAPISDVVVIVDVLSFSTCVEIATRRGAMIFPYRWRDETAEAFAVSVGAELADNRRSQSKYSLSPESLTNIPAKSWTETYGAKRNFPSISATDGGSLQVG